MNTQQTTTAADAGAAAATERVAQAAHLYDAFARGDVPAVLAQFDDRIEWRLAEGHPYRPDGAPWIGREALVAEFFARLAADFDVLRATPDTITATPDGAVVQGRYTGTFKTTARPLEAQFCHVLRMRDGRITHFQQYLDTARLQWTMGHTVAR